MSDQLLVQTGREMIPTYRAETLAEPLSEILGLIDTLLGESAFDPTISSRQFRIGTADHMTFLLLPKFIGQLENIAPNLSIQITWDTEEKAAKLRSNRLDLAIVIRGTFADSDLCCEPLFEDELVVIAANNHPRIRETLDLETYRGLRHVRVKMENLHRMTFADMQEARNQISTDDSVLVTNFLLLPFIVAGSQSVALISRRMARKFQKMVPIRVLEPPFPTETIYIDAYWSYSANRDAGHRWLRSYLREQCQMMED
jgi:LysR family nod box-dependent transcriptional activator